MSPSTPQRYHAFDSLRATMMLLGIVLHAAVNYMVFDIGAEWPYQDRHTSFVATGLVGFIHTFRMPVFFVMAGFFAAMMMERRGASGLLRNRVMRVTLPLVLFWVVVTPLTLGGAAFAIAARDGNTLAGLAARSDAPLWRNDTWHLWFLLYLSIFYVAAAGARAVARWITAPTRAALSGAFERIMASPLRSLVLGVPLGALIFLQGGQLVTDRSWTPGPVALLSYGTFFTVGWLLWHHQSLLPLLERHVWKQVIASLVIGGVAAGAIGGAVASPTMPVIAVAAFAGAIVTWLYVFAIIGLALRWSAHERPVMRYLTDASYWMYLVHVPLMFWIPGLLADLALPGLLKLAIVLATATPLLLISYHWLVRGTVLGVLLHGRRYPVEWPGGVRPRIAGG